MSAVVAQVNNLAITGMNDFTMKSAPLEQERTFKRFTPQNATTFSPLNNNSTVINIGPQGWLDPRECELSLAVQTSGGNQPKVAPLISALFRRIVVRDMAGNVFEDVDGYNVCDRICVEAFSSTEYKSNYLAAVAGYTSGGEDCTVKKFFSIPLHLLGLFGGGLSKYFPLKFTTGLQMEIFWEDPAIATLGTGVATDYTVSDVQLILPIVQLDPAYDATVAQVIREKGLVFYYNTWSRSGLDLVQSSPALYNLNFPDRYLKNLLVVQRRTADISSATTDKIGTFRKNFVEEWQFDLNGSPFPNFPIKCLGSAPQSYNMLYKSMNLYGNATQGSITGSDYAAAELASGLNNNSSTNVATKFIIGMDFETSMLNEKAVSGLDTRSVNNKVGLNLKHYKTPDASQLNAFAHTDRCVVIKENGVLERVF
jgi:hypothetical protein